VEADLDVHERYSMRRFLRRGSDSQALIRNVPAADINMINRWRTREAEDPISQ